jgi:NAD(P)-dependent dehydrogenase (short-subunit alcohol dehydrogenase family)
MSEMSGRTVVVTGANTGIGFETAAAMAGMGADVVITARDPAKGEAAAARIRERHPRARVEAMELDLARLDDVRRFAKDLEARRERLHVLVNNAGLMLDRRTTTIDGFETTFQVNHLGPFLLTNLLLDRLKASAPARIVNVSSTAHHGARLDFDDLQSERGYAGMRVYAMTKLCNILFTRELARRLEGTGVTANALHPGTVRTGFGQEGDTGGLWRIAWAIGRPFFLSPRQGARTSVYLASSPEVEGRSGAYYTRCRPSRTSRAAQDDEAARRLWEISARLAGIDG